jgi:glycosyltransferase involved in cell wall biosynthesis
MLISIIIPAFNEANYLGGTLASLHQAKTLLFEKLNIAVEIIVVDNGSTDSTVKVACAYGAAVAEETRHNVATVRNAGARLAHGDVLVFVDADTIVPEKLLCRIVEVMSEPTYLGGAIDTDYRPAKLVSKIHLRAWRIIGKLTGMAQGATQFCRKDVLFALDGYDESLYMGEDVDFYWRLKQFARRRNRRVRFIDDERVVPSTRRFDQDAIWRNLIWTNPLFILMFRRKESAWCRWYKIVPR